MDDNIDDWDDMDEFENKVKEETGKINLNSATRQELMTLPGVDEKKAKDIIRYMQKNGEFKSLDELANVKSLKIEDVEELKKWLEL